MPAVSGPQRRLFAIAEHHPEKLHKENRGLLGLSQETLHEFSSTKGLSGGLVDNAKRKMKRNDDDQS